MTIPNFLKRAFSILAIGSVFIVPNRVHARVFFITDTNDSVSPSSLRGAIVAANRLGGDNTIFLGQMFRLRHNSKLGYRLMLKGANENAARMGDLDVKRGKLTIRGISPSVTIDATLLGDRVFEIYSNAQLTLENLTIQGGKAPLNVSIDDVGYNAFGGAIFNSGILIMTNCSIVGNSSGDGGYFGNYLLSRAGGDGGGIYNEGLAQLERCVISGNLTGVGAGPDNFGEGDAGGNGAGIFNAGTIILNNCIISNNVCGKGGAGFINGVGLVPVIESGMPGAEGGSGAGIFNAGDMTLNFCTINANISGDGGSGGNGGSTGGNGGAAGNGAGIFNLGILNLNTCTISDNSCGTGGIGGHGFYDVGGVGGEGGNGGGIYNAGSINSLSCTIVLNEAGAGGNAGNNNNPLSPANGGEGGVGGGILNEAAGTNINVRNTLIAFNTPNIGGAGGTNADQSIGNVGINGLGFDLAGGFISGRFNLIGMSDDSTGLTNGINADHVGSNANPIDPLLGPLQMNGGFTPTHALLAGSPAVDQGNSFGIQTDQRGHHRPYNYLSIPNAGDSSDIGAFELDVQ